MKYLDKKEAILLLEDGKVFNGKAAGAIGTVTGEIAFNTGMTGYQEIFTDPSYYQQILVMTPSHIGNYGVADTDVESESLKIAGLVCKKFSEYFSRPSGSGTLQSYFENQGKVAICDVDTRALVRHIRNKGAMNAIISSETDDIEFLKQKLAQQPSMVGLELASKVSTKNVYEVPAEKQLFKVALIDYGVKQNIIRCLTDRACLVRVFPVSSKASELLDWKPDGIMLSNGPGDPQSMPEAIAQVKILIESNVPIFGICLGHQIIASAMGLSTFKMHNGHRGVNHPIKNLISGKGEITSQNHGFVVNLSEAEAHSDIEVTHIHLNDGTLAGIKSKTKPVFSVQYHPESSAGPNDSRYLFDDFIELIKNNK